MTFHAVLRSSGKIVARFGQNHKEPSSLIMEPELKRADAPCYELGLFSLPTTPATAGSAWVAARTGFLSRDLEAYSAGWEPSSTMKRSCLTIPSRLRST